MLTSNRAPAHDHYVLFYEQTDTLIGQVADFGREALVDGDAFILVATPEHRASIEARLDMPGFSLGEARSAGRYVPLDAAETLAKFCTDGVIDPARFETVIGGTIRAAASTGRRIRAFGEMVALLWNADHVDSAVQLEALWSDLGHREQFQLLCGYASEVLCGGNFYGVNGVCENHSDITVESSHAHPTQLRAYPPSQASIRQARHFVSSCLSTEANKPVLYDALLVVSELAANAVLHAKTAFVVEVEHSDSTVRIGVRDALRSRPRRRILDRYTNTGRGIAMIESVCSSWGVEDHAEGKTVWAELSHAS